MAKTRTSKTSRRKTGKRAEARPALVSTELDAADSRLGRADVRNLIIIAAAALALRLLFFFLYKQNNPLFYHPIMDAKYHHEWALAILAGDVWGDEVFFRAPLYPYLLAFLYKVSGTSIAFVIICQQVIGTITSVLIYLLARQFFVPRVSLLAGALAALYWPFVYFEGDLLIVTLIVFLDVLLLLLLTKSMRSDRITLFAAAGIILGLSAIARPNVLILLPFLPLAVYLYDRGREEHSARRRWLKRSLIVYAGTTIVVMPVLARNYVVGRDVVPIASQGGVNFYIGNNPQADGRTAIVPGTRWDWWGGYEDAIAMAEESEGRALKPSEVSDHYFRRGLAFIFGSPDQSIPLFARKFGLFWAGGERSNNKYIYFFWHQSGLGKLPLPGFWLIVPLGLAGGVFLWRRRLELALLYIFVLSYMLGVVAFFVNARFRLPVVPVLIIFAAYAVFYVWHTRRRLKGSVWGAIALIALCFVVVDLDFIRFRENKVHADSLSHYTLGNAYLKMNRTAAAIDEYELAIDTHNRHPNPSFRLVERNVNFNLGKLYHSQAACMRAVGHLERVGGNDRFSVVAEQYLGECYVRLERYAEAERVYRRLIGRQPRDDRVRRGLAAAVIGQAKKHEQNGNRAAAIDVLERARAMVPNDPTIEREIQRLRTGP